MISAIAEDKVWSLSPAKLEELDKHLRLTTENLEWLEYIDHI